MANEKWDTEWLIFSRKTRRGAIVLLVLFFIIAVSPRVYQLLFASNKETTITYTSLKEASYFESQKSTSNKSSEDKTNRQRKFPKDKSDPNKFSKSEWMAIGLSEKQAESVLNFKKSIGGFKSFEDLEKVYVLNDEIVSALKRNVEFEDQYKDLAGIISDTEVDEDEDSSGTELSNETTSVYEINTATKEQLLSIKGIGPFFATKIIEKREAIGGFVKLEQLLSIYNFDQEKLKGVRSYLTVNKNNVRKLNLNLVTLNQLKKHPNIGWDMAKSIIDLRTELGAYTSLDQLLLSVYIDRKKYHQIVPYFKVD